MKTIRRKDVTSLQQIPNVGPSISEDLHLIGIRSPHELIGQDPYAMYEELCSRSGTRHDPCVLDVFISAVRFMAGEPAKPWWKYTPERKQQLAARQKKKPKADHS